MFSSMTYAVYAYYLHTSRLALPVYIMTSLYSILKFYIYPRILRIVSGTITSEEGKQFGPGDRIEVYGGGIKVYIPPGDISLLQSGNGRELFETDHVYGNSDVGGRKISCLFVPNNVGLKDTHYSRKTYTRVSELLLDRPRYVKANTSFLVFKENNEMRKINEEEKLELLFDDKDVTSSKKGKGGHTIKAKFDDQIILIHDSNKQLNVDSVLDEQVHDCNSVLNGTFTLPRIMSFSNQEVHQMFGLRTGYSEFVINKYKYAVCLSECLDKLPEQLSGNMSVVRRVYCIDTDITNLLNVQVEVLKNSATEKLTASFAHDTGVGPEGFTFYDIYLQVKQPTEVTAKRPQDPIKSPAASPEDSDNSDYEIPVQATKRQDTNKKEIQPVAQRHEPTQRSDDVYANLNQMKEMSKQASKTQIGRKLGLFKRNRARSSPNIFMKADLGHLGIKPAGDDKLLKDDESDDKEKDKTRMSTRPALTLPMNDGVRSAKRTISDSGVTELSSSDSIYQNEHVRQDSKRDNESKQHFSLSEMSVSEIKEFFIFQKFKKLGLICEEENIDGGFLVTMKDEDLKSDPFCFTPFEIKKFKRLRDGNLPKL